jgi:glycosyltransferase involved in cell wall biosynthesis
MALAALEADADLEIFANVACAMDNPRIKPVFPYSDMHPLVRFPSAPAAGFLKRQAFILSVVSRVLQANVAFASQIKGDREQPVLWFAVNGSLRNVFAMLALSVTRPKDVFICYLLQDPGKSLKLTEWLRKVLRRTNYHFAAETPELARQVKRVTAGDCRVVYFPCPSIAVTQKERKLSRPLVGGFLGMPRREKGFDVLVEAIKAMEAELRNGSLRFRLQAPSSYLRMEKLNEEQQTLLRLQAETKAIDLVEQELDGAAYAALLESCDFLIIPYRSAAYARRSSLVPVEGLLNGKPLILTEGLLVTKSLPEDCGLLVFPDGDCDALVRNIRLMISGYPVILEKCESISKEWRQRYSPQAFVESLNGMANIPNPVG